MALVIGTLAGLAYLYSNSRQFSEKEQLLSQRGMENSKRETNMDRNRTKLLYDPPTSWARNIAAGNWPYSTPLARPPTAYTHVNYSPAFLAGAVDWLQEGSRFLDSPEYKAQFAANYKNAYSTETQVALDNQLVDGYWDEIITKGDALFIENSPTSVWGTNLSLYQ